MKKTMLFVIAIVGSVFTFAFINMFILKVSVIQYVFIELILSGFHWLYNKAKEDVLTNLN